MTTLQLRGALATVGDQHLPQPYVCDDLDAALRLDADVYVGCEVATDRQQQAWWRKMREAGLETYHRHDRAPISTRLPVLHAWTSAVRLDVGLPTQVLGPRLSGRRLERCRARGLTSIIAGRVATGAPAYHPEQVVVAHSDRLWIVVVPAAGVAVSLDAERLVPAAELHARAPVLVVDLTLRAEGAYAAAPGAAPLPPRHAARAVHAAR